MFRILIVEDNEMNRDMISRRLEKRGYQISIAMDGEEGIHKAKAEKPDLILMDLSLPKIDGWEATTRIKADQSTRHIPVIALTAHAMSGDREKALNAGADEYDTKPVDFPRLLSKMDLFLKTTTPPPQAPAPAKPAPAPVIASLQNAPGIVIIPPGALAEPAQVEATPAAELIAEPVSDATDGAVIDEAIPADDAEEAPTRIIADLDSANDFLAASFDAEASSTDETEPPPAVEVENAPIPIPLKSQAKDLSATHILVVDDNEDNREVLARRFVKQGYSVETAVCGEDAMEMIELKKFDVILLDIMMPGIDGIEVLKRIRKKASMVELPVIMVTAKGEKEDLVNALELGANDFITKPVDFLVAHARTRTQLQLKQEHERSERLLLNILPKLVSDMLKMEKDNFAERYPDATVMFSDLVGFTKMSGGLEAKVLVRLLNEIFSAFDDLATKYGLEKIKTMGDGYLVVGGVPTHRSDHAHAIADMAIEMREYIGIFNRRLRNPLGIRIGIATGPVVAGVIGKTKFAYDLWGDTVNIASRMESHGVDGQIQMAQSTRDKVCDMFNVQSRGVIEVKGKGQMETFFLLGRK